MARCGRAAGGRAEVRAYKVGLKWFFKFHSPMNPSTYPALYMYTCVYMYMYKYMYVYEEEKPPHSCNLQEGPRVSTTTIQVSRCRGGPNRYGRLSQSGFAIVWGVFN